ncbi:hypothetical protein [Corynebacterium pacaense]|uniref:hypothetical protein n=1 Tax=Corynebacterium pacaense TaxID=1816684 RepID=UPI0009B9E830|nr:hypothetical protein [Corynebacterium pacaense]
MAIKLTIDLSDATFAEVAAVIGYAHQLGVDPDEKLNFEGSVLSIEFDGDLQPDDVFGGLDEAEDADPEDGPLYVDDIVDADEDTRYRRRPRPQRDPAADLINEVGDAVKNIVDGFILGAERPDGRGHRGRGYGNFGPFGPGRHF